MSRQESLLGNRADLHPFGQNALLTGLWMDGLHHAASHCVLSERVAAKKKTYECVFDVLRWSFGCLMVGQLQKLQPLGLKPCLAEVRADWSAYKDILDFPSWSSGPYLLALQLYEV